MKLDLSEVEREKYVSYPNYDHALAALSCAPSAFRHISSMSHEFVF